MGFLAILGIIIALIVVAISVIIYNLGPFIKYVVEKYGSSYLKTKITVESIYISLLNGVVELRGLKVANPKGFSDSNIAELKSLSVSFSPKVWAKPFTINAVIVKGVSVLYEVTMSGTNVAALLASIAPPQDPNTKKETDAEKQATPDTEKHAEEKPVEPTEVTEDANKVTANAAEGSADKKVAEGEEEKKEPVFIIKLVDITETFVSFGVGSVMKVPIPLVPIRMTNVAQVRCLR